MKGLKTQEGEKFEKFFSIVQEAANTLNCSFFLYSGDGRDFSTEIMEGEDLMGWLIPREKEGIFEKEWESGDVSDDWSDYFTWAVWKINDRITIEFENGD